jgi:hypothetical protein
MHMHIHKRPSAGEGLVPLADAFNHKASVVALAEGYEVGEVLDRSAGRRGGSGDGSGDGRDGGSDGGSGDGSDDGSGSGSEGSSEGGSEDGSGDGSGTEDEEQEEEEDEEEEEEQGNGGAVNGAADAGAHPACGGQEFVGVGGAPRSGRPVILSSSGGGLTRGSPRQLIQWAAGLWRGGCNAALPDTAHNYWRPASRHCRA